MDQESVKPWHLWGSEQTVIVPDAGVTVNSVGSVQLARVNYKRPETWTFYLGARLLAGPSSALTQAVFVAFDLTLGVGRSSTTILGFRTFNLNWTVTPPINVQLSATTAPNVSGWTSAPVTDGFIETFPSQDIQCTARCAIPATQAGVTVSVAAYFAPRSHIRPDWYGSGNDRQHPLFSGERGGR